MSARPQHVPIAEFGGAGNYFPFSLLLQGGHVHFPQNGDRTELHVPQTWQVPACGIMFLSMKGKLRLLSRNARCQP